MTSAPNAASAWRNRLPGQGPGPADFPGDLAGDLDCVTRIPCSTAASRLPALVRRSKLQETPMPDKNTPPSGFQFGLTNLKPVESSKVALTFPDGAKGEFPKNITGLDIAKGISPSL